MLIPILSRDNKTLKMMRSLQRKKGRTENGLYFAEGVRIVNEALQDANDAISALVVSDSFFKKNENFVHTLDENGKTVYTVKDSYFREVCDTEVPQGIGAVLTISEQTGGVSADDSFYIVLDGVSEPGNVGTIIRTAEAAGADGVIFLKGCADVYNPKVVRATMGSLFRIPCLVGADIADVQALKDNGFSVVATALHNSVSVYDAQVSGKRAIVIGSEAFGVSDAVLDLADVRVRIPMQGKVESLNAGIAAGIAMYLLKP